MASLSLQPASKRRTAIGNYTAFAYSLQNTPDIGSIRETFFMNQLFNAGNKIQLSKKGDFLVSEKWVFEIGGKNKKQQQIKGIPHAYLAIDDIEIGFANRIPLWLFGFLY